MLIAFFLFETFKKDVLEDVVPLSSYATTVRRRIVDIAAKIVRKGGQFILKVPRAVMNALGFDLPWERCQHPPAIPLFNRGRNFRLSGFFEELIGRVCIEHFIDLER